MKFIKIGVLAILIFLIYLVPDLSDKKDALMAVQIADDETSSHVAYDVNKASNKTFKIIAILVLVLIGASVIKKKTKEETK